MNTLLLQGWKLSPGETAAIEHAAALLQTVMQQESGEAWQVASAAVTEVGQPRHAVLITSMSGDVDMIDVPWPVAEARLRASYAELARDPELPFLICTVLRCIPADEPGAAARLVRLRRLNMLAMELSQAYGCPIIDIDRALADIGAQPLATDYRLGGIYAAAAAGRCMATTILAAGLDDLIPYELQDAAGAHIAGQPVDLGCSDDAAAALAAARSVQRPGNLLRIRSGHQTQTAALISGQTGSRIALYWRLIRNGQLRPRETLRLAALTLRKYGVLRAARRVVALRRKRR